jgi:hypothetical protein
MFVPAVSVRTPLEVLDLECLGSPTAAGLLSKPCYTIGLSLTAR